MGTDGNGDKEEFLKYAISYLERRISLIDNKAGLLIAIQGGFFVLVMFGVKELFSKGNQLDIPLIGYIAMLIGFLSVVVTIILLIMTIKPTKCLFSLKVDVHKTGFKNYLMWPRDGFPESADAYRDRLEVIKSGGLLEVEKNYEEVHFITLQLIRHKYKYYDLAILFMKIAIIWNALVLVVAIFLKIIGF